jgi:hypothetical protein
MALVLFQAEIQKYLVLLDLLNVLDFRDLHLISVLNLNHVLDAVLSHQYQLDEVLYVEACLAECENQMLMQQLLHYLQLLQKLSDALVSVSEMVHLVVLRFHVL